MLKKHDSMIHSVLVSLDAGLIILNLLHTVRKKDYAPGAPTCPSYIPPCREHVKYSLSYIAGVAGTYSE